MSSSAIFGNDANFILARERIGQSGRIVRSGRAGCHRHSGGAL